jgi:hypothetical protein
LLPFPGVFFSFLSLFCPAARDEWKGVDERETEAAKRRRAVLAYLADDKKNAGPREIADR